MPQIRFQGLLPLNAASAKQKVQPGNTLFFDPLIFQQKQHKCGIRVGRHFVSKTVGGSLQNHMNHLHFVYFFVYIR